MSQIQELTLMEIEDVNGARVFRDLAAGMGAASVTARGAALIPSPASGHLAAFSVITAGLALTFAYVDSRVQ